MKRMKKFAALALVLVMACSMLPMTALAADDYGPVYVDHIQNYGDWGFAFEDCIYFDAAVMEPVEVYEYAYKITMKPGSTMNVFYGNGFDEDFLANIEYEGGAFGFSCFTKTDDISELYPWEFAEVNGEYFKALSYEDYEEYAYIAEKFTITTDQLFAGEVDMILFYSADITYYVMPEKAAPAPVTALVSSQKFVADGASPDIGIYNIGGFNYFKLRDIAALCAGTGKAFSVGYDTASGTITLTSGGSYTPSANDLQPGSGENKTSTASQATVLIDGKEVTLTSYNIDGYTYYQLRELCKALDIGVTWDETTATMGIDTTRDYEE